MKMIKLYDKYLILNKLRQKGGLVSAGGTKFKLPLPEVVTSSLQDYYGCHQLPFQILFYFLFY